MRTYIKVVKLTLSIDEYTVARAREAARAAGKSLNQLVREYVHELAGTCTPEDAIERLRVLRSQGAGNSGGNKILREDAYDRA